MRLSRSLLAASVAVATDFEVTSCENTSTNAAEMSISVDQAYMDLHHPSLISDGFQLVGGDYVKVIPGTDLTLNMTDSTFIYLEHELVTNDEAVPDSAVVFRGRTTTFKCKYPRAVNVGDSYTLPPNVDPDPYVGNGTIHYDFSSVVQNGRTIVTITPTHGIASLEANVQNCAVTFANSPTVYPLRNQPSWGDSDVCIDNRISTTFTYANGGAVLDWRTFHFNEPNGSSNSQTHGIACDIHVSDTLSVSAPSACSCTTGQQACKDIVDGVTYRMPDSSVALTRNNGAEGPYATGLTIPILYEVKFEMMIAQQHSDYNGLLGFQVAGMEGPHPAGGIPCGNSIPGFYFSPRYRGTGLNMVVVTCLSGNSNWYRSNGIYGQWSTTVNFGEWIEVTAGQRYNSNGDLVFYLNAGTDVAWEIAQNAPQQFTNVNLLLGQGVGQTDGTGGSVRNLTLTDMTP